VKKYSSDMHMNIAGLRRNVKNFAHNYTDAQVKVREATSNDPWGPSSTLMAEIADLTYNVVAFSEVMSMVWKRTNDHGRNWRHVYKALLLLEYLIKTGSEKVAQQCKENIYAIQTLKEFQYYEEGKDQGQNVREKAKSLVALLKDDEKLKAERAKSLTARERFNRPSIGYGSNPSLNGNRAEGMTMRSSNSEIEQVRPSNQDEEELQLQLALAMSREEAETEEAKRRSDDVRLQLAISQSEHDFKEVQTPVAPKQSNLVDLLDIFDVPPATAPAANNNWEDAWGKKPADPWGTGSVGASPARPTWETSASNIGWSQATKDPWLNEDPFKVDPWSAAAPNTNGNNNRNELDIFASNESSPFKQQQQQQSQQQPFLTEGAGLVNLDNLMKPPVPVASTNPFLDSSMFQPAPPRAADPWGTHNTTPIYPQIPNANGNSYHFQYNSTTNNNNRNFDELIVAKTTTNGNAQGNQNGAGLYPNLNARTIC